MKYLFYPIFSVAFISVLLCAETVQRLLSAFRSEELLARSVVLENVLVLYCLRLAGVRFRMDKVPETNMGVPLIVVANHQSIFDIPITSVLFARRLPGYIAKMELGRFALGASVYLRGTFNALVDRSDVRQSVRAIKDLSLRSKERAGCVVVFPEGTRSRDGQLGEFKFTGFETFAKHSGPAQLVSVSISGACDLASWPKKPIPWGCVVDVKVSGVVDIDNSCDLRDILTESRNWIKENANA